MKTRAFLCLIVSLVASCGVDSSETSSALPDDFAQDTAELSTRVATLVSSRRDYRKCSYPMCSGWYVKDLNGNGREQYITGFDFRKVAFDAATRDLVRGAADNELVLRGVLAPSATHRDYFVFQVREAYRGMPGKQPAAGEKFYVVEGAPEIRCIAAPCPSLRAIEANYPGRESLVHGVDVGRASATLVDQTWLTSRVTKLDAVVAARFTTVRRMGVGSERLVDASQVYVKLPAQSVCPLMRPAPCPTGQIRAINRDEDRCLSPGRCVPIGVCAAYVPSCAEGYTSVSWQGGSCPRYACDPTFSLRQ